MQVLIDAEPPSTGKLFNQFAEVARVAEADLLLATHHASRISSHGGAKRRPKSSDALVEEGSDVHLAVRSTAGCDGWSEPAARAEYIYKCIRSIGIVTTALLGPKGSLNRACTASKCLCFVVDQVPLTRPQTRC